MTPFIVSVLEFGTFASSAACNQMIEEIPSESISALFSLI